MLAIVVNEIRHHWASATPVQRIHVQHSGQRRPRLGSQRGPHEFAPRLSLRTFRRAGVAGDQSLAFDPL